MSPVLFEIFGLPIFSYTTFLALAILGSLFILHKLLKRYEFSTVIFFDRIIFILLFAWIFGRVFHIIFNFSYYQDSFWEIFNIFDGEAYLWGVLFGLYFVLRFLLIHKQENIRSWYDVMTPAWMWAMTLFYAGSFFAQRTFGVPTEKPWGVVFEGPNFPLSGVSIQPIDAYIGIICLLLFISSFIIVWRKRIYVFPGMIFFGSLFIYSLTLIIIQPLLMSPKYIAFGVDIELFTSWIFFIIALIHILLFFYYKYGKKFSHKQTVSHRPFFWNRNRSDK